MTVTIAGILIDTKPAADILLSPCAVVLVDIKPAAGTLLVQLLGFFLTYWACSRCSTVTVTDVCIDVQPAAGMLVACRKCLGANENDVQETVDAASGTAL